MRRCSAVSVLDTRFSVGFDLSGAQPLQLCGWPLSATLAWGLSSHLPPQHCGAQDTQDAAALPIHRSGALALWRSASPTGTSAPGAQAAQGALNLSGPSLARLSVSLVPGYYDASCVQCAALRCLVLRCFACSCARLPVLDLYSARLLRRLVFSLARLLRGRRQNSSGFVHLYSSVADIVLFIIGVIFFLLVLCHFPRLLRPSRGEYL